MHQSYGYSYKYIQSGGKPPPLMFITVNGNDITILGKELTRQLITGAPAHDPVWLLGSNGTDPTKSPVTAVGRAWLAGETQYEARRAISMGPASSYAARYFEPLLGGTTGLTAGLATSVAVSGSVTQLTVTGRSGVLRFATGITATANSRASVISGGTTMLFGRERTLFAADVRLSNLLPDGVIVAGRYQIGFFDTTAAAQPGDALMFRFQPATSANWLAVSRQANIETVSDTGIPVVLDQWDTLWIDVDATGTTADFYIGSILVATLTSNIPSNAGRNFGWGVFIIRTSADTTDLQLDCDYLYLRLDHTTKLPFGI